MRTTCLLALAIILGGCGTSNPGPSGSDGAGGADSATPETCDLKGVAAEQCEAVHALRIAETPAPSRGNRFADNEDAARLGFKLFFNTDMGKGVGCPTCHLPELAFTDRKSVSKGKEEGTRNAPTVFNAADLKVIFWDGKADSLWSQPLFAIENPLEMASTRLELAHFVADSPELRPMYEAVFGDLSAVENWPAKGKPGDAAFDDLPAETQHDVNLLAANVGKSLDAYMRKNRTSASKLDHFLDGNGELDEASLRGLNVFAEKGCIKCHSGPMLTDEGFHDVGFPSLAGASPDEGRAGGVEVLKDNVFNLAGPFADPGPGVPAEIPSGGKAGEFRTPSLRNVTRTDPYGHDGALASLREVLALHAPDASDEDIGALLAFFQCLNGEYPLRPWSDWPNPQ